MATIFNILQHTYKQMVGAELGGEGMLASAGNCGSVSFLMGCIHHSYYAHMASVLASANRLFTETIWTETEIYYGCFT